MIFLTEPIDVEHVREIILAQLPELDIFEIKLIYHGDDSVVADINGKWIVKFPKNQEALEKLEFESRLLGILHSKIENMIVPCMKMLKGEFSFTIHEKIKGDVLTPNQYELLSEQDKNLLASKIHVFFIQLHSIPAETVEEVGAKKIKPYLPSEEIRTTVIDKFKDNLEIEEIIFDCLANYDEIHLKEEEIVFGYFDFHGNNLAFDHVKKTLYGVFDFADAGFDDYHKELHCLNWISFDLTRRVAHLYNKAGYGPVDISRVNVYTMICRLSDYVSAIKNDASDLAIAQCYANITQWAEFLITLKKKVNESDFKSFSKKEDKEMIPLLSKLAFLAIRNNIPKKFLELNQSSNFQHKLT